MKEKILVVDDERAILDLIRDELTDAGMIVTTASSGEEALDHLAGSSFDLVILDIMLGGISGLEVCRRVRQTVLCPILFLSAKSDVSDVITGLGLGADDYLTKPFVLEELLARVQAHLRRQNRMLAECQHQEQPVIQIGAITLDLNNRMVTRDGEVVSLSTREFELLSFMMQHAGETFSRDRLFHEVWKTDFGDAGAVAINIKNLRAKLDPDWVYIKTIWGSGYRFVTGSGLEEQEDER